MILPNSIKMRKLIIITLLFISVCFACQRKQTENEQQKVWLHRANEIKKAQYFQNKYAGLEIDITYIDSINTFMVQHSGGMHEPNQVTLKQWFSGLDNADNLGFWLDFKNLNDNNQAAALKELKRICSKRENKKFKIKRKNVIIESWSAKNLSAFQKARFKTSYYIPSFKPNEISAKDMQKYTNEIRDNINSYNINTISGYYYQYQFMHDSFPDRNLLIWYHFNDKKIQEQYIQLANNDDNVKVLLVADNIPEN